MFRSMSPIIVTWILIILLVVGSASQSLAQECKPASSGRLTNIIGGYDSTANPASKFRNDMDKKYFKVWPETIKDPPFRFFCQDGMSELVLSNFTATCDQTVGKLDPRPYYDVGVADSLQPYWKHWKYSEIPISDIQIHCERNDMRSLYSRRIWKETFRPAITTTIVILISLECAAIFCGFLWGLKLTVPHAQFPKLGLHDTVADCIQILLLVMAGFCMIEGVSHSNSKSWRSTCMLDAAVIYTYLTFFAFISSFLRQVATACESFQPLDNSGSTSTAVPATNNTSTAVPATNNKLSGADLEKMEGNDWRWQRVFNQIAVVILMTGFLRYNENFEGNALDDLVSVIWSVIIVAATWSIGVSFVIGCRAVIRIARFVDRRWPISPMLHRAVPFQVRSPAAGRP